MRQAATVPGFTLAAGILQHIPFRVAVASRRGRVPEWATSIDVPALSGQGLYVCTAGDRSLGCNLVPEANG